MGGRRELGGQGVPSVALCTGLPTEPPCSSLGVLLALAQFLARREMLEKLQDAMVARVGFHRRGCTVGGLGAAVPGLGPLKAQVHLRTLAPAVPSAWMPPPAAAVSLPRPFLRVLPCCLPSATCQLPTCNVTLPNTS